MKHSYKIVLFFRNGAASFNPLCGIMRISSAEDKFELTRTGLTILYHRSKPQKMNQAFNSTRLKKIKELWLLYYGLTGSFPDVTAIRYECDKMLCETNPENIGLPVAPKCEDKPSIQSNAAEEMCKPNQSGHYVAALSYLYASRHTGEVVGRFRYLWSSLNCLYKRCGQGKAPEYRRARELLGSLAGSNTIDEIKEEYFEREPNLNSEVWRWNDFLSGFSAFNQRNRTRRAGKAADVLCDADRSLLATLKSRNAYKKWRSPSDTEDPMTKRIASFSDGVEGDRFLFVFSYYLYWYRCDTMHGNSPYPVFLTNEEQELLCMFGDVLEKLIVACINFLCDGQSTNIVDNRINQ